MAEESDALEQVVVKLENEWLSPELVEHDRPTGLLYHYTDTAGFEGIIKNRCLWATDYRFLNDRREMVCGEDVFKEVADELSKDPALSSRQRVLLGEVVRCHDRFKLTRMFNPFIVSFSTKGNLLSQWRAYSADGAGFSLGFEASALPPPRTEGMPITLLAQCRYGMDWFRAAARSLLISLTERFVNEVSPVWQESEKNSK